MGGSIVSDPKDAFGSAIGLLAHYEVNQLTKAFDSCASATDAEDPGLT